MCYTGFMQTPVIAQGVYPATVQNLPVFRIRAFDAFPNLTHAIFTRQGGVSRGSFQSLNLSIAVGDDRQAVAENFQRACRAINLTPAQTVACHLIHSARVLTVNQTNRRPVMGQADGLVTGQPDIYLAMRFGDCTPLIFFDPVRGAVGLTHAGWRGTMQNAAGATVKALVEQLGCRAGDIMAVIGPAIGPCCYQVGDDVMAAAAGAFSRPESLFIRHNGPANRPHFDLWAANRRQLADAGVKQIIQSRLCTACHTHLFFSHQAEQGRTGRFGVIIGLGGGAA